MMVSRILFFILTSLVAQTLQQPATFRKILYSGKAQGTTYHITYYAPDTLVTQYQVDSLLISLDSALSAYLPYSLISQFNNSKTGIAANRHLETVVNASIAAWHDSRGIFDITIAPITAAWGFGPKKNSHTPSSETIRQLKKCVGSQYLEWRGHFLAKSKPCVQLDVNGIAQGYSVDVLANFLEQHHISAYVVELGGELRIRGPKPGSHEPLKIGIEVPGKDQFDEQISPAIIYADSGAITTSGNYRKYLESGGRKINHLIDARSGQPESNELISVTVYARDAITADAYDNILMVLGLQKGLAFVEARPSLAAHFIYRDKSGKLADTASSRFYPLLRH